MNNTIPVETGAEAFLEMLNANGVEYIFLNPGTDTFALQEAICKFKALGKPCPEPITCLHESVALAAAHGYFMVRGRPQVVFVHADLGLQQVGGALHNAQRGRIGVILCSGKVPSNIDKGRGNQVHWLQEQFDQAGTVRNYVKWEYELRSNESIHHVVQRAFQVATSEPSGPVYLAMPQDLMAEKISSVTISPVSRHAAASVSGLDTALLEEIGEALIKAENLLIITGYSGRHPDCVSSLVNLAEVLGARVISAPHRLNFPTNHPLYGGIDPSAYIKDADVILVVDNDVPYIPSRVKPREDARIIQVDIDPLKVNLPMWGFPADILVQADSARVFPVLTDMILQKTTSEQRSRFKSRFEQIEDSHRKMKEEWLNLAEAKAGQKPLFPEWVFYCVNEALDENTIVLGEVVTNMAGLLRQLRRTQPGTYFQSGGSNLGWGLGAALGTRLACPDRMVVTLEGDGSFVFGCPTAALWAASTYQAPFLCIILNNMQYTAPRLILNQSPTYSRKTGNWVGTEIKPPPDYAAIARACNAYGERVEEPARLKPALQNALEQVQKGRPAVVDVIIDCRF
jgi:acetolactate synthase-1/2/3 large subunit